MAHILPSVSSPPMPKMYHSGKRRSEVIPRHHGLSTANLQHEITRKPLGTLQPKAFDDLRDRLNMSTMARYPGAPLLRPHQYSPEYGTDGSEDSLSRTKFISHILQWQIIYNLGGSRVDKEAENTR